MRRVLGGLLYFQPPSSTPQHHHLQSVLPDNLLSISPVSSACLFHDQSVSSLSLVLLSFFYNKELLTRTNWRTLFTRIIACVFPTVPLTCLLTVARKILLCAESREPCYTLSKPGSKLWCEHSGFLSILHVSFHYVGG